MTAFWVCVRVRESVNVCLKASKWSWLRLYKKTRKDKNLVMHTHQTFSCERVSVCVLTCNERIRTWEKQNKTRAVCFSMLPLLLLEFLTSVFRFQNSQLSFSLDIMELSLNVTRFLVTLCLCAREKSYTCSFSLSLSLSLYVSWFRTSNIKSRNSRHYLSKRPRVQMCDNKIRIVVYRTA